MDSSGVKGLLERRYLRGVREGGHRNEMGKTQGALGYDNGMCG